MDFALLIATLKGLYVEPVSVCSCVQSLDWQQQINEQRTRTILLRIIIIITATNIGFCCLTVWITKVWLCRSAGRRYCIRSVGRFATNRTDNSNAHCTSHCSLTKYCLQHTKPYEICRWQHGRQNLPVHTTSVPNNTLPPPPLVCTVNKISQTCSPVLCSHYTKLTFRHRASCI